MGLEKVKNILLQNAPNKAVIEIEHLMALKGDTEMFEWSINPVSLVLT